MLVCLSKSRYHHVRFFPLTLFRPSTEVPVLAQVLRPSVLLLVVSSGLLFIRGSRMKCLG